MSWLWRSFLGRSHPLLLSRLRPVRRYACRPTAVLGNSKLIGSRGYASNSSPNANGEVKRHLYVVLDDRKHSYGIHKLDLSAEDGDDDLDGGRPRPLPDPPLLRVSLVTVERAQFAAVGSSIVAIGKTYSRITSEYQYEDEVGVVLVYDTKTSTIVVAGRLPDGLFVDGHKAAMAVGSRLYMLESASEPAWKSYAWNGGGNLHCLEADGSDDDHAGGWKYPRWYWSQPEPPLTPPFHADYITAYAAHAPPGKSGHEIFVSVRAADRGMSRLRDEYRLGAGTFSFSTASREWTRRGDWQLPAHGHAHYDGHLGVWLGLHAVNDGEDTFHPRVTDGRLCIGDVAADPTEWKVGTEKLFRLDEDDAAGWTHVDAKLVPMATSAGGGSDYCIMERLLLPKKEKEMEVLCIDGVDHFYEKKQEKEECLLRLTGFHVKRGHDGQPVATARQPPRYYKVFRQKENFEAQAFWM